MAQAPPLQAAQSVVPPPADTGLGQGPGVSPEAFAIGSEAISQKATSIPTLQALNGVIRGQPGSNQLSESQYKKLVDTWTKTRTTHDQPAPASPAAAVPNGAAPPVPGAAAIPPPQGPPGAPPAATAVPAPVAATPPGQAAPRAAAPVVPPPSAAAPKPNPDVPQMDPNAAAPTAAYKAPDVLTASYKPPEEKKPPKGLEYLAVGLSLLFPNAPIGRAAAGFAQGLAQNAKTKNAQAEKQAELTYESERDKDNAINAQRNAQAQADFEHARDVDAAKGKAAQITFANQQIIAAQRDKLRGQGLNPDAKNPDGSYKPFQYPPVDTVARTLAGKGPVTDDATRQAYTRIIQAAARNGDTTNQTLYAGQLTDFNKRADEARQTAERWKEINTQIGAENSRQAAGFAHEETMEGRRERFELLNNPGLAQKYQAAADAQGKEFQSALVSATKKDPLTGQGALTPDEQGALASAMKMLRDPSTTDPVARAQALADGVTKNPTMQVLLTDYGAYMQSVRQSRGQPISAQKYDTRDAIKRGDANAFTSSLRKAGIDPANPVIQENIAAGRKAGRDDDTIIRGLVASGYAAKPPADTGRMQIPASQFPSGRAPVTAPSAQFRPPGPPPAVLSGAQVGAAPVVAQMVRLPLAQRAQFIAGQPQQIRSYLQAHQYDPVSQ